MSMMLGITAPMIMGHKVLVTSHTGGHKKTSLDLMLPSLMEGVDFHLVGVMPVTGSLWMTPEVWAKFGKLRRTRLPSWLVGMNLIPNTQLGRERMLATLRGVVLPWSLVTRKLLATRLPCSCSQ